MPHASRDLTPGRPAPSGGLIWLRRAAAVMGIGSCVLYVDTSGRQITATRASNNEQKRSDAATYRVALKPGEDGRIVAQCVELSGAITDGANEEEALRNMAEAICLYLEPEHPKAFNLVAVGA